MSTAASALPPAASQAPRTTTTSTADLLVVIDLVKRGVAGMAEAEEGRKLPWQRRLHQPLDPFHGLHSR